MDDNIPRLNLDVDNESNSDLRVSSSSIDINPSISTLGIDSLQRRNLFVIMEL
jgi:hypothetical protein